MIHRPGVSARRGTYKHRGLEIDVARPVACSPRKNHAGSGVTILVEWRSRSSVARLAPTGLSIAGAVLMAQFGARMPKDITLVACLVVIPTACCALAAALLTTRKPWRAALAMVGGLAAEAMLATACLGSAPLGGVAALLTAGAALLASSPVLVASIFSSRATDVEAGDRFLVFLGVWFAALELGIEMIGGEAFARGPSLAAALLVALGAMALGAHRIRKRRAWCARVARGQVPGWRLRAPIAHDDAKVPPLFPQGICSHFRVLEHVADDGTPYRGAAIGTPVARVFE